MQRPGSSLQQYPVFLGDPSGRPIDMGTLCNRSVQLLEVPQSKTYSSILASKADKRLKTLGSV